MWAREAVQQVSTAGDLKKGTTTGAAEVPGEPGVQEESRALGEEDQKDHGAGAEATAGAGRREVGGVMLQGDPLVQEMFAKSVERSLRAICLSTWQSSIKTFPSGKENECSQHATL